MSISDFKAEKDNTELIYTRHLFSQPGLWGGGVNA